MYTEVSAWYYFQFGDCFGTIKFKEGMNGEEVKDIGFTGKYRGEAEQKLPLSF